LYVEINIVGQPLRNIDTNICPSIMRVNLLQILISISVLQLLTSILRANIVIFHLLKVFIVADVWLPV